MIYCPKGYYPIYTTVGITYHENEFFFSKFTVVYLNNEEEKIFKLCKYGIISAIMEKSE